LSNTPDNLFQVLWPLYIEQITKIFFGVKKCLHEGGDDLVSHEQVGSHPSEEGEGSRRLGDDKEIDNGVDHTTGRKDPEKCDDQKKANPLGGS